MTNPVRKLTSYSIDVNVIRFYTDVDGGVLPKASGLIPATLKTKFPFYMFGAFDIVGGYKIGNNALPSPVGTFYLMSFINGAGNTSYSITGINPLNTIQGLLNLGDIVHVFTDSINAPTCFAWIVQQSNVPIASVMLNTETDNPNGVFSCKSVRYVSQVVAQWNEPIQVIQMNDLGDYYSNAIVPAKWRTPTTGLNDAVSIELRFDITQFIEIATNILFASDNLQFSFIVESN